MSTPNEELLQRLTQLHETAQTLKENCSERVVRMFAWQFEQFSSDLLRNLEHWETFDTLTLERLKSGTSSDWLDIQLIDELVSLFSDEFGQTGTEEDHQLITSIQHQCSEIRAFLNTLIDRPADTRLPSPLDSPLIRQQIDLDFDQILYNPVREMIEKIKQFLASDNLTAKQRQHLEYALRSAQHLYILLQTARPLIQNQDFRGLGAASYQYRTPFCGLTGYFRLYLRQDNEGLNSWQLDQLRDLEKYGNTILNLVNNMVDTTNALFGFMQFHPEYAQIFDGDQAIFSKDWGERFTKRSPHIHFNIHTSTDLPLIKTDRYRLYNALIELIENAFKYTDDGQICVAIKQENEMLIFRVQDTGVGIPECEFERIFKPFTQVGEQKKGLGVGLFLARHFAETFAGSLTVESQVGVGSTFTLCLPTVPPNECELAFPN